MIHCRYIDIPVRVCRRDQTVFLPVDGIVVGSLGVGIRVVCFCLAGPGVVRSGHAVCGGVVRVQFQAIVTSQHVSVFVKITGVVELCEVGTSAAGTDVVEIIGRA
ncbi:hypothetical protein [Gimesia fumaroli]|uniref:hypothetical protein n=1 Tax=Gimesia fumaroli TaxID=2527976 RepID=UPI0011A62D00|nr:hypothetical protein [Gimesia fumaroli]